MPKPVEAGPAMPFSGLWRRLLTQERGADAAVELIGGFQREYETLRAERGSVTHRGLRRHLYGNIFPQLAAYRTLSRSEGADVALGCVKRLHFATLVQVKKQHERAASIPGVFSFYRLLVPWMLRFGHPAAGWDIDWVENSGNRIYARVHRCFYQDCLESLGAGALICVYCSGDDYVFGDAHSRHIKWTRERTRPNGDAYCDVRYERPMLGGSTR